MDAGGSFGQYTVLAPLAATTGDPGGARDALIAQWAAEAGFARLVVIDRLFPDNERPRFEPYLESTKKAAGLQHPNIRQIHEVGAADGQFYVALEYLEGITFHTLLRRRGRAEALSDPRLFCALLAQACEGIHHAHTRPRLLHGALKPEHLFVTSGGTVKILGLGLGELTAATRDKSELGDAKHYSYLSPEQILGRRVDARADVFTLGIIAWEALTGRRLFSRATRVEVYRAITEKPIPPPRALAPSIPSALDRAVARALARDPNERYKSARELGLALEEGVTELGAPLSTVAIASLIDRCFALELENQRSTVQTARRKLSGSEDSEDIFEVPTRLYDEGQFDPHTMDLGAPQPASQSTEVPTKELIAQGTSPVATSRREAPDPMADILEPRRDTPADLGRSGAPEFAAPPASAFAAAPEPEPAPAFAAAPASPAATSPAPASPAASAAGAPPAAADVGLPSDLFSMPDPADGPSSFGAPPASSPNQYGRPPETLSDVADVSDIVATYRTDKEDDADSPPPPLTGLSDADAAAAAAGATVGSSAQDAETKSRGLVLVALLLLILAGGAAAYYMLVVAKGEEPASPVQLEEP